MNINDTPTQENPPTVNSPLPTYNELLPNLPREVKTFCQQIFDNCFSDEEEELLAVHMRDYLANMNEHGLIIDNPDTAPPDLQIQLRKLYSAFAEQSAEKGQRLGKGTVGYVFIESHDSNVAIKTIHNMSQYFQFIEAGRACTLRQEHYAMNAAFNATKHLRFRSVEPYGFTPSIPPRYTMERIKGKDLEWFSLTQSNIKEFPNSERILSLDEKAVTEELLRTLDTIHAAGAVHRDIHHKNIMLGEDSSFYIIDFGSAERLTEENATHFETWKSQDRAALKSTLSKFFTLVRERLTKNPN